MSTVCLHHNRELCLVWWQLRFHVLTAAAVAALLFAGCSGGGKPRSGATSPGLAPTREAAALATPAGTCPRSPARTIDPQYGLAAGSGPVYVVAKYDANGDVQFGPHAPGSPGASFAAAKLMWVVAPAYAGGAVVRAARVEGVGAVKFGQGPNADSLTIAAAAAGGWRAIPSNEWVTAGGCYAFVVQGEGFSETIYIMASVY